ncbi:LOW QUALITY PROTEIN: uncharacterized protein EMH_0062870 [Eimeria mitis]|uniref:Uncharacterized protein n=1 Tax=Eimeria mitis TaxID=44415 RepID=U6K1Z7_9EIME|nr:LOW QUALITY PROTEIN: uncharacterized protein EMH_0062870 [Eimeria mitis]CDJ30971.1 hypothetical protein EMH_0062870 [Eimeria mitis]
MVALSPSGGTPSVSYDYPVNGISASLRGQGTIHDRDELPIRPRPSTASPSSRARSLLAAFVVVSAVVFLAYACSFFIRKRVTASSSSRRLADSSSGDECEDSRDSSSTASPEEASPETQQPTSMQLTPSDELLLSESETVEPTTSARSAAAGYGKVMPGEESPPSEERRSPTALKRKGEEPPTPRMGAKPPRLDIPIEETASPPPPPPLDPDFDEFIEKMLREAEEALSPDTWVSEEGPRLTTMDWGPDFEPPALEGDPQTSGAAAASGGPAYELPPTTSTLPSEVEEPKEESVSAALSPAGSSGSQMQQGSPHEVESPPSSGTQMQQGSPHEVESPPSGPFPDAAETATGSPEELAEGAAAFPKEGGGTSSEETDEEPLPSSSGDSASSPELPPEFSFPEDSESPEQLEPGAEGRSDADVIARFPWLGHKFGRFPESELMLHPFYRQPGPLPELGDRAVNMRKVERLASRNAYPSVMLTKYKDILRIPELTERDIGEFIRQIERLIGYALGRMAVTYKRSQASCAIDALGMAFITLDALYCAAELLGDRSMKQHWWDRIISRIEPLRYVPSRDTQLTEERTRNADLARALDAALDYFRAGERPAPILTIGLKEALFCEPGSSKFRGHLS